MKFDYYNLKVDELAQISFVLNNFSESPKIAGVYYKRLVRNVDERGDLTELWSEPWSRNEPVAKVIRHIYFNTTHEGIVKGWHVHEETFSQYTCVVGKMEVVLADVREKSKTFGVVDRFIVGTENPSFIKIPPGC